MRILGEQWIEEVDGVRHMVKVAEPHDDSWWDRIAECDGGTCAGACALYEKCKASGNMEDFCPVAESSPERSDYDDVYIKDLGPVNEEGCLAEERTGLFPKISRLEIDDCVWVAAVHDDFVTVMAYGNTEQEAIDAWNRRAR